VIAFSARFIHVVSLGDQVHLRWPFDGQKPDLHKLVRPRVDTSKPQGHHLRQTMHYDEGGAIGNFPDGLAVQAKLMKHQRGLSQQYNYNPEVGELLLLGVKFAKEKLVALIFERKHDATTLKPCCTCSSRSVGPDALTGTNSAWGEGNKIKAERITFAHKANASQQQL